MPCPPDDPRDALLQFGRWPAWMWANEEVCAFSRWLRQHRRAGGLSSGSVTIPPRETQGHTPECPFMDVGGRCLRSESAISTASVRST
ncbi:erythromycin esterase family protein [Phytoactinopolyspora alkaliphila]|uniref:erythromycin esterase family protein n=1 Tax=Phytoactinopolyspora alkaliphila TaxID=1783498 RepID=UPI001C20326E